MWIRVESYPAESSPETPAATWHYFCGNLEGELFALGRKQGGITFPVDKSVSRQHAVVRCLAVEHPTLPAPRNDAERQACNNAFGMCLVLENTGKAGTYVTEIPETKEQDTLKDNKASGDDDDEETDDEGVTSQKSAGISGGTVARLGDGVVCDLPLSAASHHFYQQYGASPVLIKLDVGQSRVLCFPTTTNAKERSIMLQVGLNGSTLKITWVPFAITFSNVSSTIQKECRLILPNIGATEESSLSKTTTHLIVPEIRGTAKPLIAWCMGLPIVTPDYLRALVNYKSGSMDPLPLPQDFKAPPKDENEKYLTLMQTTVANPKLMASYVVLTCDDASETDLLVEAAGATLVPLHEERNADAMVQRAKEVLEDARHTSKVCLVLSTKKRVFQKLCALDGVFGVKAKDWAKAVAFQNPALENVDGHPIPVPSNNDKGESNHDNDKPTKSAIAPPPDDSDTEDEGTISQKQERSNDKMETQDEKTDASRKLDNESGVSNKRRQREDSQRSNTPVDSSETQVPTRSKRQRDGKGDEVAKAAEPVPVEEQPSKKQKSFSGRSEKQPEQASAPEELSKDDDHDEQFPVNQDDSMEVEEVEPEAPKPRRAPKHVEPALEVESDGALQEGLRKADANGWFTVAPKDNTSRKALRKKASKTHAEENGEHFMPPAQSENVPIVTPNAATTGPSSSGFSSAGVRDALGRRPRRTNGPDFRRFRKNIVPRKVDPDELIPLESVQARESEQQRRMEENQREIEEEQRRADALFREIGGGGTVRRKRRE